MLTARPFDAAAFQTLPGVVSMDIHVFEPLWAREVHRGRTCELLHVLNGTTELVLGRKRFKAGPGDTLLIAADQPHRDAFDMTHEFKAFMIHFRWPPAAAFFRRVDNVVMTSLPAPRKAEIARIIDRFRSDVISDSAADRLVACTRLHTILSLVLRETLPAPKQARRASGGPARRRDLMLRARAFIQERLGEPLTLEGVARALGVSSFYLSHVFSQESDLSLFRFLTTLRMERARELLRRGDRKIAAVAADVGFDNPNYFARAFRRHFGCLPSQMRRR